jgi:hypothetical protein
MLSQLTAQNLNTLRTGATGGALRLRQSVDTTNKKCAFIPLRSIPSMHAPAEQDGRHERGALSRAQAPRVRVRPVQAGGKGAHGACADRECPGGEAHGGVASEKRFLKVQ